MPDKKDCPICNNESNLRITKGITKYYQCCNCKSLFCEPLNQEGLVGGEHEVERNEHQNHLRVARAVEILNGIPIEQTSILDFGCGAGLLIDDLNKAGYPNVTGYDSYNEKYLRLPEKEKYHLIIMVEVAEHFSAPYIEFDVAYRSLVNGGCIMIETGYLDAAFDDGHTIDDWFYLNPDAGHSTIYSNHGIDILMMSKGFRVKPFFNNYVRLYQKVIYPNLKGKGFGSQHSQ